MLNVVSCPLPPEREATIWDMEEKNLHERHQLLKQQLKDQYFLQRHQLLKKHEKVEWRPLSLALLYSTYSTCWPDLFLYRNMGEG